MDLIYEFTKRIIDTVKTMRSICSEFDKDMNLGKGSGLSLFKYLIINKIIELELTQEIDINLRIPIINVKEELINRVEAI